VSIIERLAATTVPIRRSVIAMLLIACVPAAWAAVTFSFADPALAAWWPAAALSGVAAMLSRGKERPIVIVLVIVATGIGNLLAGRPPVFALFLAMGNAVETVALALLLAPRGRVVALATVVETVKFVSRTLAAAALGGIALAIVAAVAIGRPFLEGVVQLTFSHAAATVVLLPLLFARPERMSRARTIEAVVQATFLVVVVVYVFWPGAIAPLAFTPLAAFLWAAMRMPLFVVAWELTITAVLVIVLTGVGGGPFAAAEGRGAVIMIQLFLMIYAGAALLVVAARHDERVARERAVAREHLLREGIVNAEAGILIAERRDDTVAVIGMNDAARRVLGLSPDEETLELDGRIARALATSILEGSALIEVDGSSWEIVASERPGSPGVTLLTAVFTDVSAQRERERLALEAAEDFRRLSAQKDDFIASVSHELRTPVTSILGFAEQLNESKLSASDAQAAEIVARNARRLADVIEDVLELSRLSAVGGTPIVAAEVDLVDLAKRAAQDAEGLDRLRQVRVEVRSPDDHVVVSSSARDLERVCANLVSNAVKFSPSGSAVEIEVNAEPDGGAVLRVVDQGIGIPPEHAAIVWERFGRVPTDAHREVPGTGLGLPIVKALVEQRLGGSVSVLPREGGGTIAEVRLPSRVPTAHAPSRELGSI